MTNEPIKVLFDPQIFLLQRRGGISRYFVELIKTFNEHPELGVQPVLSLNRSHNLHAREDLGLPLLPGGESRRRRILDTLSYAFTSWDRVDHDLVHHTYYSRLFLRSRSTSVSTLYDMIPETYSRGTLNPHLSKKMFMRRSDLVLSISETSLSEMRRIYDLDPTRVSVTHLGVEAGGELSFADAPNWLPNRYFLFVGQRGGYKQGELAIRAFQKVEDRDAKLVFVSSERIQPYEADLVRALGMQDRIFFHEASSFELPHLYKNAKALVFPSLTEGFGFPPLEALEYGTPVVAFDNPINREISGDTLHYFSESTPESLAAVLNNHPLFDAELASPVALPCERYSWLECARRTARAYSDTLGR